MSGFVEKVKDKVQQVTHSGPYKEGDDTTHTGTHAAGHTGTHTTGTHTTGTHTTGTHTTGTGIGSTSTNAGPHDSNLANKLDPRVDSDRDGSRTAGTGAGTGLTGTTGTHHTGAGLTGTTGTTHTGAGLTGTTGTHTGAGLTGTTGTHNTSTAGPHSTNIANKLDPRVDSDRDGSSTFGSGTTGSGLGSTAGTGLGAHSGLGSTGTGYGSATGPATGTAGPHSSNLLNKADPRVDSDRDGSHIGGTTGGLGGVGGAGLTGTHHTGGVGHSGIGGTTGTGLGNTGPGPAPNTAGPHSSDLLNKADPRVDSDLDGSKTVGGNATYHLQPSTTYASDSTFAKSIDAAFRNDSAQTPTHAQVDGTVDESFRGSSPPDAAKHTPEKFKQKLLDEGKLTKEDLNDHEDYRREHLAGNEAKETLDKYGSGIH